PQRYPAQPYEPSAYERSPYAPQPRDGSPYAPVPYNPSGYGSGPYSPQPSNPAPYAPLPYQQRPTSGSPYGSSPYAAPVAYVPATGATPYDAGRVDRRKGKPVVTPFRVVTFIALVISASIAAYSLLVARGSQVIPVTVAALAVFGVSAALLGVNIGAG